MNELLSKIYTCSSAEFLLYSICSSLKDALKDKKISKDEFKTLSLAYLKKGEDFGLANKTDFNRVHYYAFKNNLYSLEACYDSAQSI